MQQQTTQQPVVGSAYEEQLQHQDASLVMTEEQMETLRRQISVYSTICRQLMERHKASLAQPPPPPFPAAGGTVAHMPYDPMHKATSRQRWSPTQVQLQILERIFEQGRVTPSKQRIKEITTELSCHGPIAETNVYNWFQNRKARAKRKQASATSIQINNNNNTSSREVESEADTDGGDSPPVEKRSKRESQLPTTQQHYSSPALDQENRVNLSVVHEKLGGIGGDRPPRERSLNSLFCEQQPVFAKATERPSWSAASSDVFDVYQTKASPLQRTNTGSRGMSNGASAHCLSVRG